MDRSTAPTEWKPEARTGGCSHLSLVPKQQQMTPEYLARSSFNMCMAEAARHSGMEDQALADEIHISPGYMSRFMRGVGQQWARRLVAYMRATNSLAPLQWLAEQMGCDLVIRAHATARIRALEAELKQLRVAA